jgi:hypothetical protein
MGLGLVARRLNQHTQRSHAPCNQVLLHSCEWGPTLCSPPPMPPASPSLSPAGGQHVRPHATTLGGKLLRLLLRVVLWGTAKVQQLLWRVRWLVYANGLLVALMISIHLASPDPHPAPAAFPLDCPRDKRFGCSRVAEVGAHGARGVRPLYLESSVEFVQRAAEDWVAQQVRWQRLIVLAAKGGAGARLTGCWPVMQGTPVLFGAGSLPCCHVWEGCCQGAGALPGTLQL